MSYRNPKIYAADPLAFSQSFMQGFKNTFDAFQKVSEDIKKQKEKDDLIQADFIKFKNIGDLEGVNTAVNNGIQQSVNFLVDPGTFAGKSAAEKQKDLNNISKLKTGSQAFVKLYNIDLDELSNKSKLANPELDAVFTQLKADPSKVKITGDKGTIDVKFTTTTERGITHTVSLRDMNKYLSTYTSIAEDEADWENNIGADSKMIQALIEDDANKGISGDLRSTRIAEHLNKKGTLDADTSSYLFYEKISDDKKGGVSEWHPIEDPEGNKLDEKLRKEIWAAQDKLIQDVYIEELEERIYAINIKPQPTVSPVTKEFAQKIQAFEGTYNDAINFINSNPNPEQIKDLLVSTNLKDAGKYSTGKELNKTITEMSDEALNESGYKREDRFDENKLFQIMSDGSPQPVPSSSEAIFDIYMNAYDAPPYVKALYKQQANFNNVTPNTNNNTSLLNNPINLSGKELEQTMDYINKLGDSLKNVNRTGTPKSDEELITEF